MRSKTIKTGLLLVLSTFALVGCSTVNCVDQLPDYKDPIVTNVEGQTSLNSNIYNNIMKSIYDGIHDGSLPSDTLDKVFYTYSISMFGKYNGASEGVEAGEITLTEAVAAGKDGENFKQFLANHPVYQRNDIQDVTERKNAEFAAVEAKLQTIKERIATQMYDKMNSASNKFREKFYEEKFVKSLYKESEAVKNPYDLATAFIEPQLIDPSIEKKDVFTYFLTEENYGGDRANGITYIEDKILPGIYRSLLTEQYIAQESSLSIGRSYARKVNIIEVEDNDDYKLGINYLLNNYYTKVEKESTTGSDINLYSFVRSPLLTLGDNKVTKADFDTLNRVVNGLPNEGSDEEYIMEEASLKANSFFKAAKYHEGATDERVYYEGTEFSSLIKSYEEMFKDSSHFKEFTDGTYSVEVGMQLKEDQLRLKNHVKSGWFIKSDLSSYSFVDKLFDLKVATAISKSEKANDANTGLCAYDRYFLNADGEWELGGRERDYNSYVCRINGSYFLKNTDNDKTNPNADILFREGNKYYIVQIEEAVSSSELQHGLDPEITDETVKNEVLKLIANTGSYESLAKEYWIEKMNLKFYDQAVYDYFKSTYPDIFKD